jgi:hypothetical protein
VFSPRFFFAFNCLSLLPSPSSSSFFALFVSLFRFHTKKKKKRKKKKKKKKMLVAGLEISIVGSISPKTKAAIFVTHGRMGSMKDCFPICQTLTAGTDELVAIAIEQVFTFFSLFFFSPLFPFLSHSLRCRSPSQLSFALFCICFSATSNTAKSWETRSE